MLASKYEIHYNGTRFHPDYNQKNSLCQKSTVYKYGDPWFVRPQIHFSKRQLFKFNDYQISLVKAFPTHLFDSTLLEQDIRGWVKHLWTNAVLSKKRIHRSLSGSSEYTVQRNSWTKLLDVMTWRNQCSNDTGMCTSDHWKGCDHRNDICIDPRTHRLELHATIHKWTGTLKRTCKKKKHRKITEIHYKAEFVMEDLIYAINQMYNEECYQLLSSKILVK